MPIIWHAHCQVPDAAPLPPLTALDVVGDLPTDSHVTGDPPTDSPPAVYDKPPLSYFAAQARPGALAVVGAPLANHVTSALYELTLLRCAAVPKEGQPRGPGYCGFPEHPQRPARAGDW